LLKPKLLAQESINVVHLSGVFNRSRNCLSLLLLLKVINGLRYAEIPLGTTRGHLIERPKRSCQVRQRVLVELAQNGGLLLRVLGYKRLQRSGVRWLSNERRDFGVMVDHIGMSIVFLSGSNYLGQQAFACIILQRWIDLAYQLCESALSNLVALSTWQVRDVYTVLGQIACQNKCLLKLKVVVFLVDTLIFIIFT
jgi:hypothetical protein